MTTLIKDQTVPSSNKRVTFGIEITSGSFKLNEWGLHETQAKEISELLTLNGDQPVTIDGLTFSRRQASELSSRIAAMKASLLAK
jgi:hypothetical protein